MQAKHHASAVDDLGHKRTTRNITLKRALVKA
jgi:hypothetical protein